jgi:hypothetical protein
MIHFLASVSAPEVQHEPEQKQETTILNGYSSSNFNYFLWLQDNKLL